jgi:hypothetical protein
MNGMLGEADFTEQDGEDANEKGFGLYCYCVNYNIENNFYVVIYNLDAIL